MEAIADLPSMAAGNVPAERAKLAVVIPCYNVARHILGVLSRVGPECALIYVIDDACPEHSGDLVENHCDDPRVRVVRHDTNRGVGGAVLTGYLHAIRDGATVIAKIDGDGQMAPELLADFVAPILHGRADYTKGNRFYNLANLGQMPYRRVVGNAALSFMTKLSSGYWDVFDPTNGYTAIHVNVARQLPFDRISKGFFFETDMLFRLNTLRAVVVDIPMAAQYGDEASNLRVSRVFGEFLSKHARNTFKRIVYNYFLRDFTIASVELIAGLALLLFGTTYGIVNWIASARIGIETPPGTVMLAALPVLLGLQLLLAFIGFDVASTPRRVIHPLLGHRRSGAR